MPYSLVLHLVPRSIIPTSNLSGRHLHALFLELVDSVDPELARALHQQEKEKAFVLSPLQVAGRRERGKDFTLQFEYDRPIAAGTPCWWRIGLLDEGIFGRLTHLWLSINPQKSWHLGATELQVVRVLGTPQGDQPWANFATYPQIYAGASESDRKISLRFCTPATFRVSDYDAAMPTKEAVFNSLLKRWNSYSGIPFDREIITPLYPSRFDIWTEIVTDSRSKLIGCVGEVTFGILGEVEPEVVKRINALGDFALYAGVGRKTPMGMGMVRRVSRKS